jgi:hypothetical protein
VTETVPTPDTARRIVRTELGVALPPTGWWPLPLVALVWALLVAASDRSRLGLFLLYAAAALCTLGVVWAAATDAGTMGLVPLLLYGLAIGSAANRLLFGVVRDVPAVRREAS